MKKPSLAVIIASGKGKKSDDDDEEYDEGGDFAAAADELADSLGVDEDKRESFRESLEACIRICK